MLSHAGVDARLFVDVRETHLKLNRFGNDLSVSAHLETAETSGRYFAKWSLRRTAADGSAVQRSATWDASRQAFLISRKCDGARQKPNCCNRVFSLAHQFSRHGWPRRICSDHSNGPVPCCFLKHLHSSMSKFGNCHLKVCD